MQFFRKLEPLLNVGQNQHFTLDSKKVLGNVVERMVFDNAGSGALLKANIDNFAVRLNGKQVVGLIDFADLDLLTRYLNIVNDAGRQTVEFTELRSRNIQGQLMGSIDTDASGVTSFVAEGDIATATTPFLTGWVQMRTPGSMSAARGFDQSLRPIVSALIRTDVTDSAAGQFPHDLNYGSRGNSLLGRIAIFSSVLTSFQVKADSVDQYEDPTNALAGYVQAENGLDDQAGMIVWDPLMDGNQPDAVPTRVALEGGGARERNFEFLFRVSGAGSHRCFTKVYTTLPNL